jgi:predicted nucleic acid-binding protein
MSKVVLLDTGPLSQVAHPRIKPEVKRWLQYLEKTTTVLRVPEIADYELRRELLRQGKQESIDRLNQVSQRFFIPLTPETMRKAADLWAWVRNQGQATASNDSLDGDVILAAQAIFQLENYDEVEVITTNLKHISRFQCEGISVKDWNQVLKNINTNPNP